MKQRDWRIASFEHGRPHVERRSIGGGNVATERGIFHLVEHNSEKSGGLIS